MTRRPEKDPDATAPDGLTHLDEAGHAHMVDVGPKAETVRIAEASGRVEMSAKTLAAIREGTAPKGDVLAAARIAGIQAAKRTADLIPLCHPLRLDAVEVDVTLSSDSDAPAVLIRTRVRATDRTGVEMEALTAASVAALTVYDMVKALDRGMRIGPIQLESKEGGRSGRWSRGEA